MQVQIPEGAGLFLFTDGLTEARDGQGEEVGREGLEVACARIAGGDPAAVLAALRARGFGLGEDDCTLMAVQLLAKDSVVQTGEFEPAAEEAEGWASRVQSELEMAGWTEDAAAMAGLVAMEHMMNLQDHADVPAGERCMLRMSVDVDRGICVLLFRDPGRKWIPVPVKSVPLPASLADTRERGRGWQLIQSICSRTTYFRREGWNHHRFEISKAALGLDAADRPEAGGAD
jgi:anti-sigma regulatory factor (Ser/Thr protein kinase)